jgi:Kelch motif protein
MKHIAGTLVFMAFSLSACSVSFGTIGSWSIRESPPTSLPTTNSVVLPDGEVVFLGGFDVRTGQPINRPLLFDPKDNQWSQGAPMPDQQSGYAIVALSNGSVLVAGGGGLSGGANTLPVAGAGGGGAPPVFKLVATTWLFNPQLDRWTKGGDLNVARSGAAAVLLTDGRVLIAGGSVPLATPIQLPDGSTSDFEFSTSAEIFDPQSNSWSLAGSMHFVRGSMALLALRHGMALAAGGCAFANQQLGAGVPLNNTEVFDPSTTSWTVTAPLPEPKCGATGVLLRDGRALVTGGSFSNEQKGSVTDAFLYDEPKRSWSATGSTVSGASAPILLADGKVFVAAIQAGPVKGALASFVVGGQIFDPASGDWSFATSTSALVPFRLTQEGPASPTVLAQSDDRAVVLLGAFGLVYMFSPLAAPPPVLILDSSGLELVLIGLAAALWLSFAIQYLRGRRLRPRHSSRPT